MDLTAPLAALQAEQSRTILGANHAYRRDGVWKPGVTSIKKVLDAPALDDWRVNMQAEGTARAAFDDPPLEWEPVEAYVSRMRRLAEQQYEADRIADEAARIGTETHALVEYAIRSELGQPCVEPDVSDAALLRFAGWKRWAKDVALTPLAAEARVYNHVLDYCGTIDALVLVEGAPALLDWKPTPTLWPERRLQSAAYRAALASMGFPWMRGAIVCLPREGGEASLVWCEEPGAALAEAVASFAALLVVYRWLKALDRADRQAKKAAA
jgi:hypothetical protein